MTGSPSCPVCRGNDLAPFVEVARAPVFCNVLLPSRSDALAAPVGSIVLSVCGDCSHVSNTEFDDTNLSYSPEYENSLHFSPTFQGFATTLADSLVSDYDIHSRQVVELGCGKGDFLEMLAAAGSNDAVGFDPSYDGAIDHYDGPGSVRVIRDTYQKAGRELRPAFVASRHVLEHLTDPGLLVSGLKQWAGANPVVYLEVPDADYMFAESAVWDVIYEHPSYFTGRSLARLCSNNGLVPFRIESVFGGQYLTVHARLNDGPTVESPPPVDPTSFGREFDRVLDRWADRLAAENAAGGNVVIWGAGSKGASFAAVVEGASETLSLAIDLNPRKNGRFMPISGIEVATPDDPRLADASLVLVMNPLYGVEIREELRSRDLRCSLEVVG